MEYLAYLDDVMEIIRYVAGLTHTVYLRPNYVECQVCHRNVNNHQEDCVVKKAQEMLENIARPFTYSIGD